MFVLFCFVFFFNDTATTEIYTLSLHDALPILGSLCLGYHILGSHHFEVTLLWGSRCDYVWGLTGEQSGHLLESLGTQQYTIKVRFLFG